MFRYPAGVNCIYLRAIKKLDSDRGKRCKVTCSSCTALECYRARLRKGRSYESSYGYENREDGQFFLCSLGPFSVTLNYGGHSDAVT